LDLVPDKLIGVQVAHVAHRLDGFGASASQLRLQVEIDATSLFWRIPWEYARHERILRMAFQEEMPFSPSGRGQLSHTHKWGGDALTVLMPLRPEPRGKRHLALLHAAQLKVALRLYQAKNHGKLPPSLNDLVPGYLPAIPVDPFDGKPFRYRISRGENLALSKQAFAGHPGARGRDAVAPPPQFQGKLVVQGGTLFGVVPVGRAILWSVGEDECDDGGNRQGLQNVAAPNDLIYLVPPPP
jgi:hypothetical protein